MPKEVHYSKFISLIRVAKQGFRVEKVRSGKPEFENWELTRIPLEYLEVGLLGIQKLE